MGGVMTRASLALGLLLVAAGCDSEPTEPTAPPAGPITGLPRALSVAEAEVIEGSNAFAFGLLREVRAAKPTHNTFLSPLSASMALGMAMTGAAGESWTQMRDVLGFAGLEEPEINGAYRDLIALLLELDPAVEVGLGNALWSDASRVALLPDFVARLETYFGAETGTLDFTDPASRDVINGWVEDVTRGRIEELIEEIDAAAVAYLVNAIYFLAGWRTPFDEDHTRDGTFTRADGSEVTVPFMNDEIGYRVLNPYDATRPRGVELPYAGGAFTAVAVLPPVGQGIDGLLAELDVATWEAWMAELDAAAAVEDTDKPGHPVSLPRFELAWKDSIIPPLEALGMEDVFDARTADLSRMNGGLDLHIGQVIQQTFVKVDEKGTEAAAATAVIITDSAGPLPLLFNRPFLFAIRERYSGTILFLGVIGDPAA